MGRNVYNRNSVVLKPIWNQIEEWGLDKRKLKIWYTEGKGYKSGFILSFTVVIYNRVGRSSKDISNLSVVRTSDEVLS